MNGIHNEKMGFFKKRLLAAGIFLACSFVAAGCQESNKNINQQEAQNNNGENNMNTQVSQYYTNPINTLDETTWYDYGTGDPYVMRHNGVYYLYCSTRDTEIGIKCWSSRDLVNWNYEGFCTSEVITKGAYAPEVVYYNGKFYMYTSPAGKGHYVLSADSPTGPFSVISDNLGMSIDGSVFIDDDGKWYFYHADGNGIKAHEMTSPSVMRNLVVDVNAKMNGWTEGPMVIKHDGRYFLTYTGNHVFSRGYRIDCGVGSSPVTFKPFEDNPVLLHSEGNLYGIGHSSSVKGPDLDSFYIIYHSLIGRAKEGMPKRVMNIDRIVFNENFMDVLGPTTSRQKMPQMPDIYSYFDSENSLVDWNGTDSCSIDNGLTMNKDSKIISKETLGDQFTAEYNVSALDKAGQIGVLFSYTDENNYGSACFDLSEQKLIITFVSDKKEDSYTEDLPKSFSEEVKFDCIQSIQVEKDGDEYIIYVNDHQIGVYHSDLSGGSIGYYTSGCRAKVGFIGGSNEVKGSSANNYEKPVPGTIQAVHYMAASRDAETGSCSGKGYVKATEGDQYDYLINAEESGTYDFLTMYATKDENASYALFLDGTLITSDQKPLGSTGSEEVFGTEINRNIELAEGCHTLTLKITSGTASFLDFTLLKHQVVEEISLDYETNEDNNTYTDGAWRIMESKLHLMGISQAVGKRLYGSENWGDYMVEADLMITDMNLHAGLLFRVTNPSMGDAGNSPAAGVEFLQGYYAAITDSGLMLIKQNYNRSILKKIDMELKKNEIYHMKVTANGANIKIYLNDNLTIEYTDSKPYTQGKVGVKGQFSVVEFDNFKVSTIK